MSQEHLTIVTLFVTWGKLAETRFPDYVKRPRAITKMTSNVTDSSTHTYFTYAICTTQTNIFPSILPSIIPELPLCYITWAGYLFIVALSICIRATPASYKRNVGVPFCILLKLWFFTSYLRLVTSIHFHRCCRLEPLFHLEMYNACVH